VDIRDLPVSLVELDVVHANACKKREKKGGRE